MEELKQLLLSRDVNLSSVFWIINNASIHTSGEAKDKIRKMELQWLTICPYSPSLNPIEKVIGIIKSKCRSKFYNNGLQLNSRVFMAESKEIVPKTIKECVVKSKIESTQQLQVYLNYWS